MPRLFATLDPDLKEKLFVLHLSGVLLTAQPRSERPGAVFLMGLALGVWAFALLAADQVHGAAEVLFRAIGS